MNPLSEETLSRIDRELAGVGFSRQELQQIAPQIGAWRGEVAALEELELSEVEPSLTYFPELL